MTLGCLAAAVSVAGVAGLSLKPPVAGAPVALVFPPFASSADAARAALRAGGALVGPGGAPNVVVAVFPRDLALSDVWAMGAWASLDPARAAGCLAIPPS